MSIWKSVLAFFCLVSTSLIFSQEKLFYKGIVRDASTSEVIPYATVAMYTNAKLIGGVSTDEQGRFELTLTKEITHLEISFIGYETYKYSIAKKDLKNIIISLQPLDTQLDEVIIKSEKTTTSLEIDKKIIRLGTDLQQAGTTALEAFDQIAEIQADLGTGSLSLRGSNNVRLLINGKPSPLSASEVLDQIPASSIAYVELITSPSAKNQADGLSGIINIVLQKNMQYGINLSVNPSVGTKRYLYGFDSNYHFSNVNVRFNGSHSRREMDSKQWISQLYTNNNTRDLYAPHDFQGRVERIASGIDFFINEKSALSFQVNYTNDFHSFYNDTFYTNVTNTPDFVYTRNSSHTHKTIDYNVNYRVKFDREENFLEVDYNLTDNENTFPAEDFEDDQFLFRELLYNKNQLHAFALDYAIPLEKAQLETGFSWNYRELRSNRTQNTINTERYFFDYDENLIGLYALIKSSTGKLSWQAGLRYEKFNSMSDNTLNNESVNLNFSNFFPSVHLSYQSNEKTTLSAGYSKRITRPDFRNINPFQIGSQYFQWNANPNLRPEFSDNFEVNYQYNIPKFLLSLSAFYRDRKDVIQWLRNIDENGVILISFDNIGNQISTGLETNVQYKLMQNWSSDLSANYYYTKANQPILTWNHQYSSNLIFKNTFKISKTLSADLSYRHTPKDRSGFYTTQPRNRWDFATRLKLLENRLVVNLRIVDVLNRNLRHRTIVLPNVVQNETWRFQSQTFGWLLSLNYKIFQNKERSRTRKRRNYSHGGSVD